MSDNIDNSSNAHDIYHVKGETVSAWIPLSLATLGVITSILIAQLLLFSNLKIGDLLLWPPNTNNQYELEKNGPTGHGTTESTEGKAEKNPAIINKVDGGTSTELNKIKSMQALEAADSLRQEPSLMQDCPPIFFFSFFKGSATPTVQNLMPEIKRLENWLRQYQDKKIFIEGHTDSYGTEEYNLLLSYRRAKAAEKILIEAGIPKRQVITRAFGDQEPLQGQPPQSKKNRRASIKVEGWQACINLSTNGNSNE